MKLTGPYLTLLVLFTFGTLIGCSQNLPKSAEVPDTTKSADVSGIRKSLDEAGFKDVSASNDSATGAVMLNGTVGMDSDRARAETIAHSMAGGHMVSNQITVMRMDGGHMGNMGNHRQGMTGGSGPMGGPRR